MMDSEEAPSHSPQVSPFIFQTNQNVSQAAALRAGSALWGSRAPRAQLLPASPLGVGDMGVGGQDKPGSNKDTGLSRKQGDGIAEHCRGAETQTRLEAVLRLSGHHREAVASRA